MSGSGSANSFGAISGTTNASGVFTTTLASTLAQTETITATEGSIHETTTVSFVPSAISATRRPKATEMRPRVISSARAASASASTSM